MSLKTAIMGSPVYPVARSLYRSVMRPDLAAERRRMRTFYQQFIERGEVVFDIGALYGEYAECFRDCGGLVVTVEPNPAHHERLVALAQGGRRFALVRKAVGAEPGSAVLNVCSTPGYSTLLDTSAEWFNESPDYEGTSWTHRVEVPVTTIDEMIAEFGSPYYVKIDVEGFELGVLKGMSHPARYISFEFGTRRKEDGLECLRLLGSRGYQGFRPILGRDYEFATPDWLGVDDAIRWLEAASVDDGEYGDMFVRWSGDLPKIAPKRRVVWPDRTDRALDHN